ncbi:MAG TPA: ribonuclease III [Egibacteraceae bacterium]|nr:ribonuclease III [Egibacteraceae bacterium]
MTEVTGGAPGDPGDSEALGRGPARTPLETALGVAFRDRSLLSLALSHRSHAFEAGGMPTNERLEFLGDAVLGVVVTDAIYRMLPDQREGRLAKVRAAAVNTISLAMVARPLGIGDSVRLGRGEELSGGRDKDSILADTLEALIGAVYLDQGIEAAAALVHRLFDDLLDDIIARRESLDYKTSLQELTASELATLPIYEITEEGPDHQKRFTAAVVIDEETLGRGKGRSKKEAEQQAAREAYSTLGARLRGRAAAGPRDTADDAVVSDSARGAPDSDNGGTR